VVQVPNSSAMAVKCIITATRTKACQIAL
jgi:hypothetical protein